MPCSDSAPLTTLPLSLQCLLGGTFALLFLGACGSLPTTMNSLPVPPDSVGLQSDPLPSPQSTSTPLSLTPQLRERLQLPQDQPVLLIEGRESDIIAQIPTSEVMRWIGGQQNWPGIEGIDLRLTVGEYRETATAQLRMGQSALFTFSDPPEGRLEFEATAFLGTTTVAEGQITFASSTLDPGSDTSESEIQVVPLVLNPREEVPFLQGLQLEPGQSLPLQTGVYQVPLATNTPITLTGQHLDQVAQVLFASVLNPSGMTSRPGQILQRSPESLQVLPPPGLGLTSTAISVQTEQGIGLGTLHVTWQPDPGPTASPSATASPSPPLSWRVETLSSPESTEFLLQTARAVVADAADHLLIADSERHQILLWDPEEGQQIWAGSGLSGQQNGPRAQAQFRTPVDLAWQITGDLLVVDQDNHQIRRISPEGEVSTVAGSGQAGFKDSEDPLQAQFNRPSAVAVAPDGSLFVADSGNHRIRQITPKGQVLTVAGTGESGVRDGAALQAQFNAPSGLALDAQGRLWIADRENHRLRQLTPEGQVITVAGSVAGFVDGDLEGVRFKSPVALALAQDGSLLIADRDNYRVRQLSGSLVTTLAGQGQSGDRDGTPAQAQFRGPQDLWVGAAGQVFVVDQGGSPLRQIIPTPLLQVTDQLSQN